MIVKQIVTKGGLFRKNKAQGGFEHRNVKKSLPHESEHVSFCMSVDAPHWSLFDYPTLSCSLPESDFAIPPVL